MLRMKYLQNESFFVQLRAICLPRSEREQPTSMETFYSELKHSHFYPRIPQNCRKQLRVIRSKRNMALTCTFMVRIYSQNHTFKASYRKRIIIMVYGTYLLKLLNVNFSSSVCWNVLVQCLLTKQFSSLSCSVLFSFSFDHPYVVPSDDRRRRIEFFSSHRSFSYIVQGKMKDNSRPTELVVL